ncbi:MAG TPA: prepilin-type N-terminal cleavage/methylation domain-containing protein [Noviherbaspirillum sp.]|nr:prepilin-type N-terminal cleavage/methylation domain-containing protein [Noviherbaspirillum sp.]
MTALFIARNLRHQRGATMVELVVTLIIVSILAAFVVPRFFGTHGFEERGLYDETVAALRYAQKTAVASRRMVCINFTAQTVSLRIAATNPANTANCSGAADLDLAGPDGITPYKIDTTAEGTTKYRNATVKFKDGAFPSTMTFDPLGKPNAGATIEVENFAVNIRVEAETGYVH